MKKKLPCSFFGNTIRKSEGLSYHISTDFHATFAASHTASSPVIYDAVKQYHVGRVERKYNQ
ncbi:hypothetical protein Ana3638_06675 [Anaerocolumna sedimenticola]|uniref:Uncharacterized protein n=1 Tax=Anaerocolumna sedimenticola TaxID=2696063 RepID=A0A6P1TJ77_9FIRM|nr:hypothetical protein [Anaerocolumna sedimenticola]QHQ60493.1 hypothetical protein Ana3638_06675 [Anaerocolumna sedimenticola]